MKEQIGKTAGAIWDALQKNERLAISKLPKIIKQRESLTYQAVGWLAREDKVDYEVEGKKTFLVLTKSERVPH
jgi:hypothetical protein